MSKRKLSAELQTGDCVVMPWSENKVIADFEDGGAFPYIERIAVFTDGTYMCLEKGLDYEVMEETA